MARARAKFDSRRLVRDAQAALNASIVSSLDWSTGGREWAAREARCVARLKALPYIYMSGREQRRRMREKDALLDVAAALGGVPA